MKPWRVPHCSLHYRTVHASCFVRYFSLFPGTHSADVGGCLFSCFIIVVCLLACSTFNPLLLAQHVVHFGLGGIQPSPIPCRRNWPRAGSTDSTQYDSEIEPCTPVLDRQPLLDTNTQSRRFCCTMRLHVEPSAHPAHEGGYVPGTLS